MKYLFSLVLVIGLICPLSLQCDIWKHHINSNRCDKIIRNENELWVYSEGGGLTRWDIMTGEYTRYNDS
ncbi:hypothetical protein KKB18_09815, partial [bacterium]|nr:hypothetical protein [bacterium]